MNAPVVLDTGVLIAHERRTNKRVVALLERARLTGTTLHVPSLVWAEWLAGGPKHGFGDEGAITFEPVDHPLSLTIGEALAALRLGSEHIVDASVMATAASLGAVVYTGDIVDMQRMQSVFPAVRLFSI